MIDTNKPDYANTPASSKRPHYGYVAGDLTAPRVSIITAYYNTGPVFQETVRALQRMSFQQWEWLLIDDGSNEPASLHQLQRLEMVESRVRVIHQENAGPAAARNRGAAVARGRYLLLLDSDDLVEPTFVEKAVWVLETQPQFAACNSCTVTFGDRHHLWPHGFEGGELCLKSNRVTNQCVIRREAYLAAGGQDEGIRHGHEDWDFWLRLAQAGHWGHTLPEYLTWYRRTENGRMAETAGDERRHNEFAAWLRSRYQHLAGHFPSPRWTPSVDLPGPVIRQSIPVENSLEKPEQIRRILLIVPWLAIGGADKLNLDTIRLLTPRGYEFTVVTTRQDTNPWLHEFSAQTPDIFPLHTFLNYGDYPIFLRYLIESRQIDAVIMSNSQLAYSLAPYLRGHYPHLAILDYNHSVNEEVENWKNAGYPRLAVRAGRLLDLNVANTRYLRNWMIHHGADPDRIEVCQCGIDTEDWNPAAYDRSKIRSELGVPQDQPIVLFVGRFSEEKRPLFFAKIMQRLTQRGSDFAALMIGDGPERRHVEAYLRVHRLTKQVRLLGALPNETVRRIMAAADVLVVCSKVEGLALVLFECMAMEIVPVAVDIAGHSELITQECGYLVPRSDDELAVYVQAIADLLEDPRRRRRMARQARQQVVEQFDLRHLADDMEQAIQRAIQLAAARQSSVVDEEVGSFTAMLAIEAMRMEVVADLLWAQRSAPPTSYSMLQMLQRTRQKILPIGTQRYEVYKMFRQWLREVDYRRRVLSLRRRGKAAADAPASSPDMSLSADNASMVLSAVPAHDAPTRACEVSVEEEGAEEVGEIDTDVAVRLVDRANHGATHGVIKAGGQHTTTD